MAPKGVTSSPLTVGSLEFSSFFINLVGAEDALIDSRTENVFIVIVMR